MIMSSRLKIPSIQSLIAFEQVARLGSFTQAAVILNLTQGAVSKQIATLEKILDVSLFSRTRKGLVLTEHGKKYLSEIEPHLLGLAAATPRAFQSLGALTPLRVRGLATLNDRWLFPRLNLFMELCPKIKIEFSTVLLTTSEPVSPSDVEIRFGSGNWSDVTSKYLVGSNYLLVASATFLSKQGNNGGVSPSAIISWPRYDHIQAQGVWAEFAKANDIDADLLPPAVGKHEVYSVLISAVVNGLAAALVPACLIKAELASGALINVNGMGVVSTLGYHVCWPSKSPLRQEASAFIDWLLSEANSDESFHAQVI
jgi:LysR family transcriptional regulator, glycine cleavage system transcriptional activator